MPPLPRHTSWAGPQEGRCGPARAFWPSKAGEVCHPRAGADMFQINGRSTDKDLCFPAQRFPKLVPKDTGSVRHLSSNKFRKTVYFTFLLKGHKFWTLNVFQ